MSGEGVDDRLALARVAAGDKAALAVLVEHHQGAVFRVARRLTGDDATAEDVLQETFVSALRHAGQARPEGSVRGWLLAIARNTALMARRRRVGEPAAYTPLDDVCDHEGLGEAAGFGMVDPEAWMMASDRHAALEHALARLSEPEREVLVLRDVEELSGEETARALGLTVPAMKSRLHRARLRLVAELREGGFDAR